MPPLEQIQHEQPHSHESPMESELASLRQAASLRMQAELMIRATFTSPVESNAWVNNYARRFRELVQLDPTILDHYRGTKEDREAALQTIEMQLYF